MTTSSKQYDRTTQDVGNIVSLDHLNIQITDQRLATIFYIMGLGFTRDPYITVGVDNMWVNLGRQQFHLPTNQQPQVVRGRIELVVPDLDRLAERLESVAPRLEGTSFDWERSDGHIDATCPWGNRFRCREPQPDVLEGARLGLASIQFNVPEGAAAGIGGFYSGIMGAPSDVHRIDGQPASVVHVGRGQSLVFREEPSEDRPYDRHHIAVYLADFSGPHRSLGQRDLVWQESNEWQYRFTDIVDLESGKPLYQLEHEVRSMRHPMFARPLVNRNPAITSQQYIPGADAFVVG